MKYFSLFEDWKKENDKPDRLKKETYMFRDIHVDDRGDIKGICKFCEEKTGRSNIVDVADHTNNCPSII